MEQEYLRIGAKKRLLVSGIVCLLVSPLGIFLLFVTPYDPRDWLFTIGLLFLSAVLFIGYSKVSLVLTTEGFTMRGFKSTLFQWSNVKNLNYIKGGYRRPGFITFELISIEGQNTGIIFGNPAYRQIANVYNITDKDLCETLRQWQQKYGNSGIT